MRFKCLLALMLIGASASAQVIRGEIGIGAGVSTDQRGIRSNAISVAPAILIAPDPRFSASAALTGTKLGADSRAVGGTLTLGARLPITSNIAFAASGTGALTRTSFNASYGTADVTPTIEATISNVTLFGGGHIAGGSTTVREVTGSGTVLPGVPTSSVRDVTSTRTSVGPVFGAMLNLAGADPGTSTVVLYREEHARVAGVSSTDRVASASYNANVLSLSVSAGARSATDENRMYGSVGASLAIASSLALQASAGTYPSNRTLGTVGGSYASIGVLIHGARRLSEPVVAPGLRGAPPIPAGATRFMLRSPSASRVEIAGDWSQWQPVAAAKAADGIWYADVRLARGDYRYAFKVDGQKWVVPEGVTSVDDGFGGRSAVVTIR